MVDIGGVVVNPIGAPLTSASINSDSELHNFEFNLRQSYSSRLTLLGGFRYLELNDAFNIHYDGGVGLTQNAAVRGLNRLYGGQFGAEAVLWKQDGWALDGWIKGGLYGNAAHSRVDMDFNGVPLGELRAGRSDFAFVGDLGLRATRQWNDHIQFYAGYRVMLIDGVALAANQYDSIVNYFNGGGQTMTTDGTPFYHGAELGLSVAY